MDPFYQSHVPQCVTHPLAARIQKLILSILASLSAFMEKFFRVPAVVSEVTTDNETVTVVLGA